MGYPPGQCGYCVRSIATNHFFTSGNVIFDENIPYNTLHSLPAGTNDYSSLPFLAQCPSIVPEAPMLPPNPSNLDTDEDSILEDLGTPPHLSPSPLPVTPPVIPRLVVPPSTPHPVRMRSRESSQTRKLMEKGRIFEEQIEAERAKVTARQGGVGSGSGLAREECAENEGCGLAREEHAKGEGRVDEGENPFVSGGFENLDCLAIAVASLDADDYLQWDVDSLSEAVLLSIWNDV